MVSKAQFSSADASVAQKKAALDQALLNLQYCTIVAPVAGVVSKNVEVGMNVQPGQQLISIVPLDDVWVTANFKETQLKHMRPGQPVKFQVDAYAANTKDTWTASRRERRAIQPAAAGKCDWQLRESGAARAGENRARSRPE